MAFDIGGVWIQVKADAKQAIAELNGLKAKAQAGAKEISEAYSKASGAFAPISSAARTAFVGVAAAIGAGIAANEMFEESIRRMGVAISGEAKASLDEFRKGIIDLSVQTGQGTSELSNGLKKILQSAVPPKDAMKLLAVAADVADSSFTDLNTVTEVITTTMNAYKLTVADAARITDVLTVASQRGKISFEGLAGAFGGLSIVGAEAGASIEELGAMFSTLGRAGMDVNRSVMGLRMMLMSFLNPEKDAADAAARLGIELSEEGLKAQGLTKILGILAGARVEETSKVVGGARAMKAILPLLANYTGFQKDVTAMMNSGGAAAEAYSTATEYLGYKLTLLKQGALSALQGFGQLFSKFILGTGIVEKLANALKGLGDFWRGMGPTMQAVVLGITGFVVGLTGLLSIAGPVLGVLAAMKVAIGILGIEIGVATGGLTIIAGVLAALAVGGFLAFRKGAAESVSAIDTLRGSLASATKELEEQIKKTVDLKDLQKEYQKLGEEERKVAEAGGDLTAVKEAQQAVLQRVRLATDEVTVSYDAYTGALKLNEEALDRNIAKNEQATQASVKTALNLIKAQKIAARKEGEDALAQAKAYGESLVQQTKAYEESLNEERRLGDQMTEWRKRQAVASTPAAKAAMQGQIDALATQILMEQETRKWIEEKNGADIAGRVKVIEKAKEYEAILAKEKELVLQLEGIKKNGTQDEQKLKAAELERVRVEKAAYELAVQNAAIVDRIKDAYPNMIISDKPVSELERVRGEIKALGAEIDAMPDEDKGGSSWLAKMKALVGYYAKETEEMDKIAKKRKEDYDTAATELDKYYGDLRENSKWSTQAVINDIQVRMDKLKQEGEEGGVVYEALSKKLIEETKKANAVYVQIWDNCLSSIKSGISSNLAEIIKGNKSVGDAFGDLGTTIKDSFIDAFAASVTEKLGFDKLFEENIFGLGNLFGGLGSTITSTLGGALASVGSWLGLTGAAADVGAAGLANMGVAGGEAADALFDVAGEVGEAGPMMEQAGEGAEVAADGIVATGDAAAKATPAITKAGQGIAGLNLALPACAAYLGAVSGQFGKTAQKISWVGTEAAALSMALGPLGALIGGVGGTLAHFGTQWAHDWLGIGSTHISFEEQFGGYLKDFEEGTKTQGELFNQVYLRMTNYANDFWGEQSNLLEADYQTRLDYYNKYAELKNKEGNPFFDEAQLAKMRDALQLSEDEAERTAMATRTAFEAAAVAINDKFFNQFRDSAWMMDSITGWEEQWKAATAEAEASGGDVWALFEQKMAEMPGMTADVMAKVRESIAQLKGEVDLSIDTTALDDSFSRLAEKLGAAMGQAGQDVQKFTAQVESVASKWLSGMDIDLGESLRSIPGMTDEMISNLKDQLSELKDEGVTTFDLGEDFETRMSEAAANWQEVLAQGEGEAATRYGGLLVPGGEGGIQEKLGAGVDSLSAGIQTFLAVLTTGGTQMGEMNTGQMELYKRLAEGGQDVAKSLAQEALNSSLASGQFAEIAKKIGLTAEATGDASKGLDEMKANLTDFQFSQLIEQLLWYRFISPVDLNDYVTPAAQPRAVQSPSGSYWSEEERAAALGFTATAARSGGVVVEQITINPVINTEEDYATVEKKLMARINSALKSVR